MKLNQIIRSSAIAVVLAVVIFSFTGLVNGNENVNKEIKKSYINTNEIQNVKLSMQGWEYKLEPSTLKEGVHVKLEVDMDNVRGCMRDIVINEFGVRKFVNENDNIIEFVPTKSGTFSIVCSMNMGRGSFSVENTEGEIENYIEKSQKESFLSQGNTCGSTTGSCGCGSF